MPNTTDARIVDDLIEALKAGIWPPFTPRTKSRLRPHWSLIARANDGSLDAAKALHDALLPVFLWGITPLGNCYIRDISFNPISSGACAGNPARAWLIAILCAYRALIAGE